MRFSTLAVAATAATAVQAQRPKDTPICDYYTTALLKDNTAKNQATLLTLLVNTVVIGNYTMPNVGVAVPGILAAGETAGEKVNLAPYFTGALLSTNRGGKAASVNFLDGGAATPLQKNMPADDTSSNQYFLLTHLYEFFGALLGCSMQGMSGFDAYSGDASMYEVHKFMDLSNAEVTYFITQVALAAASFGVAKSDISIVGEALGSLFNVRCGPATEVIPGMGKQLQSICIDKTCAEAKGGDCSKYAAAVEPSMAMTTPASTPTSSSGTSPTGSSTSAPSTMPTGGNGSSGASTAGLSLAALLAGLAAFAL